MASHALLQSINANKPALCAWLTIPNPFLVRTIVQASPHLSWVVIDCEHGLIPLQPGAAELITVIETAGPSPPISSIVRIPATGASTGTGWQIKYALDAGARGVLVPMVSTAEKAREIVRDARFPPVGRRGFGSPFTHGTWGVTAPEYLKSANESVVVMVQIESPEAVQNLEEIARVDGIDVLFIGPYDLSISLGYPAPSPDPHPEVETIIQKILKVCHDAGKKCAIFCTSGKQSAKRVAEGFDLINVTSDTNVLAEGIATHLAAAVGK